MISSLEILWLMFIRLYSNRMHPLRFCFPGLPKTHHPVTLLTWAPTYRTIYKTLMSIEKSPHMKSRKPGPGEKKIPFKFKGNSQIRTE
jgi:hypothetical protein